MRAARRWQFSLRPGVQFSDGTALTSPDVAAALQELLPGKRRSPRTGTHVVVQFQSAMPDLFEQLASRRYFIYRRAADGTLLGPAHFLWRNRSPRRWPRYKLVANERCWAGRPFVDAIDVYWAFRRSAAF